jgi:hypothetical protein
MSFLSQKIRWEEGKRDLEIALLRSEQGLKKKRWTIKSKLK